MSKEQAPSRQDWQMVNNLLKQLSDSESICLTTMKPDVFFHRLNFQFDLLLQLQAYESKDFFYVDDTPSKKFVYMICNLEIIVDDFIERYLEKNLNKLDSLSSQREIDNTFFDFANALISAFDCSNDFWTGVKGLPHYSGPLFTKKNYQKVQDIFDASCESDLINEPDFI